MVSKEKPIQEYLRHLDASETNPSEQDRLDFFFSCSLEFCDDRMTILIQLRKEMADVPGKVESISTSRYCFR